MGIIYIKYAAVSKSKFFYEFSLNFKSNMKGQISLEKMELKYQ